MNEILLKALENSLYISAAVILLLLLTWFFRNKTPAIMRRTCWIVLAMWFLIPIRPVLYTVELPQEEDMNPTLTSVYSQLRDYRMMLDAVIYNNENKPLNSPIYISESNSETIETETSVIVENDSLIESISIRDLNVSTIIIFIWLLGIFTTLMFYTVSYKRFIHRIIRSSVSVTDSVLNDLLDDIQREIKLKRHVGLAVCPIINTPVVAGFFHPVVYLPDEQINYRELRFILMHEATHIKNGDMWVKLLSLSVMIIHWFNPIVYLMNRAILNESELACDASVLRHTGEDQRMHYGQTVFQAAKRSWQPKSMLASAFSDSGKSLRRRLSAIIKQNSTRRWLMICCAIVLLLSMLTVGLIGCYRVSTENPEQPYSDVETPVVPGETPDINPSGASDEEPDVLEWKPEPIKIDTLIIDPNQTGDLIIYLPPFSTFGLMLAVDAFKVMYPNVNVVIEIPSETSFDAYSSQLSSELMAGTGPDIIFPNIMRDAEIGKMLNTGVFLDLNELIESDVDFNLGDYVEVVLNGGLHNGKRYIMPYTYMSNIYIASTNILNEIGFDTAKITNLVSFIDEAIRCLPKAQENTNFRSLFNGLLWNDITRFYSIELVDFERNEIFSNEEGIRSLLEAYKPYYFIDSDPSRQVLEKFGANLNNSTFIFQLELTSYGFFERASQLKTNGGFDMLIIPDIDGKTQSRAWDTTAIRSGSSNVENAWNFIKFLLSPIVQSDINVTAVWNPVHKEVLINKIEMDWYNFDGVLIDIHDNPITCTRLSEAEMRAYLNAVMGVEKTFTYESHIIRNMLNDHIKPYFEGAVSLDTALSGLRSQLTLYVSE